MKRLIIIITALFLNSSLWALQGDGSIGNPFQLYDLSDFLTFRDTVNAGYYTACAELNSDIDLKEICYEDSVTGEQYHWFAIAGLGDGTSYQGRFDGKGHVIYNLYVNSHIECYRGVFGSIKDAVILNLGVENAFVIAGYNIGGITGIATNSVISNCFVTGHIEGYFLGGIAGMADNCAISNCYCDCYVNGNYPGYVLGYNINTTLSNCFFNQDVECNGVVHDAVGLNEESMYSGNLAEKLNDYVLLNGGDTLQSWCHSIEERSLPCYYCPSGTKETASELENLYIQDNSLYFSLKKERKIQIYDLSGRLYISQKFPSGEHCITTLPKGNYILLGRRFMIGY